MNIFSVLYQIVKILMILLVTMANASYSFEKSNLSNKNNNRINNKYEGIEKYKVKLMKLSTH